MNGWIVGSLAAFLAFALHTPGLAQSGGDASSTLPDCPDQLQGRSQAEPFSTEPFECYCSVEARRVRGAYAFGSGPYDGISNICMSALHAGATGPEGGDVRVIPGPAQETYEGSLANGVFSADWDHPTRFNSFTVEAYRAD